jgi:hypothetical protein
MVLAMADSIAKIGWDPEDQARGYVQWRHNGTYRANGVCFDI